MSNADFRGRFVWHELMTTDLAAAGDFYSKVVPWKTEPSGMPGYTLWVSGKTQAGGLMELPEPDSSSAPPAAARSIRGYHSELGLDRPVGD